MKLRIWLAGCALALGCASALPAIAQAAGPAGFKVGAAKTDVTPPTDHAADGSAFALCPPGLDGPRPFAFEEPYKDVDGNGRFSYLPGGPPPVPEPFCDANLNGRYDGIYSSGGIDVLARQVHDPIEARAVAISDGTHKVVIASVVAQGIFENYTHAIRARARQLCPGLTDMIVSANHNESSPDTIGIYGGPDLGGLVGGNSGLDDYYMSFLVEQVAKAAGDACKDLRPASLWAKQAPLPDQLTVRLSKNFPTTNDDGSPAAIDPLIRILQARDAQGQPIFTMMNLAAHNQEIGHGPHVSDISSDWPGYFERRLGNMDQGLGIFLVGDNGSEEDAATTTPPCDEGCYERAQATGHAFADFVAARLDALRKLRAGTVSMRRDEFFVPLENNAFKAAAVAGLFGTRQTYIGGVAVGRLGTDLRTEVGVVDVGPDLQFLANPGEAFPALIVGSPWGIENAGCPDRPNPPVPTWHGHSEFRLQAGLANDMIGYMSPAWGYSDQPGIFLTTCFNDSDNKDPAGHQHKLETEGVGPTAGNLIARHLTALLDREPDPIAQVRLGRFIRPDGSLSRRAQGTVGVWIADRGSTALTPGSGTILSVDGVSGFGSRTSNRGGAFMDYNGNAQESPDITSRGMLIRSAEGDPVGRFYLNVYPALTGGSLGPSHHGRPPLPHCRDRSAPRSAIGSLNLGPVRGGARQLAIWGSSGDVGCPASEFSFARPGRVDRIQVAILRHVGRACRFLQSNGRFSHSRSCGEASFVRASGTTVWHFIRSLRLAPGRYGARVRGIDGRGNVEPRSAANTRTFTVG